MQFMDLCYKEYLQRGTMNTETILQKKKKAVRVSKEEILLILRAYREHPTNWVHIFEDVRGNIQQLPDPAKELYRTGTLRQLRDRMSVKLSKLMSSWDTIDDQDISREVQLVRLQERRLVHPAQPHRQADVNAENIVRPHGEAAPAAEDDLRIEADVQPVAEDQPGHPRRRLVPAADMFGFALQPADRQQAPEMNLPGPVFQPAPVINMPGPALQPADRQQAPVINLPGPGPAPQPANRRDAIAAGLSDSDSDQKPSRRRRRLADLIRENNELYNNFMRNTVPRILREFGLDH